MRMGKNIPLCAICLLGVIAVVSFGFVYLILHHHKPCKNGECLVKIDLGHLRGRERETVLSQKTFYSFQGIPYAKPPVGPFRFKDPEPMPHWHTVIDATTEGSMCLQKSGRETIGSEDCLYLNVYTTQFPDHDISRHPVMVYFHGGGFNFGSAQESLYGPDYLIELEVVVVTVQYRLGALGFLSLGNDDIPGNAGLKDQVLALKWVNEHISHFGGDPGSVTIFGTSAGAASVQYHMLSPLSKGLFHNAMMFSGSVLNPWAFEEHPVEKAFNFGKILGINTGDPQELANFLRLKPAEDIVEMQRKMKTNEDRMRCISFPFMPSVETAAPNSFLTENPKIILETGKFTRVPTIIGVTKKEGLEAYYRPDLLNYFNDDMSRFIPPDLHLQRNSVQFQDVERRIREFYFHNMPLSLKEPDNFVDICGDVEFVIGIQKSIDYFLRNSTFPVFAEKFTFNGKFGLLADSLREQWPSLNIPDGPGHGEDSNYFFFNRVLTNITDADVEIKVVKLMSSILTSFATYQNPTEGNDLIWQQTEENNPRYLVIGSSTEQITDTLLSKEKIEFWNNIYRIATT